LIMLPSMMNMEKVRNPATTCRGSTAIWAEPEPRRPGEWEWKQGARGGEWSGVGWGRGEEGRSGATTTDREGGWDDDSARQARSARGGAGSAQKAPRLRPSTLLYPRGAVALPLWVRFGCGLVPWWRSSRRVSRRGEAEWRILLPGGAEGSNPRLCAPKLG
jgi:hypothetical protein